MKALAQVTAYRDAQEQIERLDGLESKHNDKCRDETREISTKYWDMKRKIEDRECKEVRVIENRKEKYNAKCKLERVPYQKVINDMEEIFKLMDVHIDEEKNKFEFNNPYKEYIFVDTVVEDKYKAVWIYIKCNDKPKNKFSLMVKVGSIFQWKFADYHISSRVLKDLPTEAELRAWYKKNRNNIRWGWCSHMVFLNQILEEHASLEEKYEQAVEFYKDRRWQGAYWLHQKDIYEKHYHIDPYVMIYNGKDEYVEVLEMLLLLRTVDKKLPLLIGSIKSESGIRELERRLKGE